MRRAAVACAPGIALVGIMGCAVFGPGPAWEADPPAVREAPVTQVGALQRARLDNGAHVLVLEDHRVPRVVLGVTVRRGAGTVPVERAGLALFTAEMMRRGTRTRDALALARAVDDIGAELAVSADWDSTTVSVAGLSRDLERLVDVLADVTLHPRFASDEAAKARAQQLAGLEAAKDDPATLVEWHTIRTLYPEHRYGHPLEGTPGSVGRLEARHVAAFHRRVFVPGDAIVFASGDITAEQWMTHAQSGFGSAAWKAGQSVGPGPAPPQQVPAARAVVVVDRPELSQAGIGIAHAGIARTDERRIGAQLMNDVLGGSGFSSRLMASARAAEGLTYGVTSGFSLRRHPGPFEVLTSTRVPEVRRMVDLLLAGLETIRTRPPDAAELTKAKSYAVGRFGLSLESPEAVMRALVGLDVYGLPADSLDTYRSRVRAVDMGETRTLARDLIHPERAAIVVVGPAEALVPQLQHLGPVNVVTP
jgi:zinc protease